MARITPTHLPDDEYLLLVGQTAYMVSALEGLIVFDLEGLAAYLPGDLNASSLAGMTTRKIGDALRQGVAEIADDEVRAYIGLAADKLAEINDLRNDLLHARPATAPDSIAGSQQTNIDRIWRSLLTQLGWRGRSTRFPRQTSH